LDSLFGEGPKPERLMIDATHLKAAPYGRKTGIRKPTAMGAFLDPPGCPA
jgi:hypothetical protein